VIINPGDHQPKNCRVAKYYYYFLYPWVY